MAIGSMAIGPVVLGSFVLEPMAAVALALGI
jgi:hypothetical protein